MEGVEHIFEDLELARDARFIGALLDGDCIVAEPLNIARMDEERGQPAKIAKDGGDERLAMQLGRRIKTSEGSEAGARHIIPFGVLKDRGPRGINIDPRRDQKRGAREFISRVSKAKERGEREPAAG